MKALLYIAATGYQWRMLPKDFPPYSTVRGYFYSWQAERPVDEDQPPTGDASMYSSTGAFASALSFVEAPLEPDELKRLSCVYEVTLPDLQLAPRSLC
ncbi:transposase [Rhizobium laguerreae]|nr:transposase [Rhizobium laguerreae]MBY3354968.1 transposase [Rhizobium laguerreae]MBY3376273.1 transposase [Rhizobium laguerreae]MBY3431272.1 transposase [Rhizobium laguerreae]MBY3439887.1 transposase [Rhizobium laguerreae]